MNKIIKSTSRRKEYFLSLNCIVLCYDAITLYENFDDPLNLVLFYINGFFWYTTAKKVLNDTIEKLEVNNNLIRYICNETLSISNSIFLEIMQCLQIMD